MDSSVNFKLIKFVEFLTDISAKQWPTKNNDVKVKTKSGLS